MSSARPSERVVDEKLENPRILGLAGDILFALGLAAAFLAFSRDVDADKAGMVLNAAVLLSLGYPMLLYVRALQKIAALEKRIRELEQRPTT